MGFVTLASFALVATTAQAQAVPAEEVIVIGPSLDATRRALTDCVERKCAPAEDMAASVAHAETAFVAGEYKEARATLISSLGRNRRHARTLPIEVAGLERANGRVAAHLGEKGSYYASTWGIRRALKAGLPRTDVRLVGADLEIADMLLETGRARFARAIYSEAEADALRMARPDLAARARIRKAWLDYQTEDVGKARKLLREMAESTDPALGFARLSAQILLARMDRKDGSFAASDALIAEVAALRTERPALLFAPRIEHLKRSPVQFQGESGNVLRLSPTDNFEDRWIDVGFWVGTDGRVSEVEVLRSRGNPTWSPPLLRSIAGRLYAPGLPDQSYRVERYTYTSFWERVTGTRLRQRSANARIEYMDLTADPEPAKQ